MTIVRSSGIAALALVAFAGLASATDISTVNSFKVDERYFNDFPGSSLTVTNAYPNLVFDETNTAGPGGFANKHIGWLSNDGTTRFHGNYWQGWTMNFTVNIAASSTQPRKEAGIEIHNPRPRLNFTDEGQVLIAADGEVAVFGAAMPFTGFGNAYTLGTTANVSFQYFAPGTVDPIKGAYQLIFTDAVTGVHDSGLKIWGNESDGTFGFNDGTEFGLKDQNAFNPRADEHVVVTYNGFSVVPAPGALALLGLGGLVAGRRRR